MYLPHTQLFALWEENPIIGFNLNWSQKCLLSLLSIKKLSLYPKKTIILAHSVMRRKRDREKEREQKVKRKVMSFLNEGTLKVMPLTTSVFDTWKKAIKLLKEKRK